MHRQLFFLEADSTISESSPSGLEILLTSALVVAIVTGLFNWFLAFRRSREEERTRKRELYAQAFATYTEYKEYPYVIRRRNHEKPAEERIRISEQIRQTQERLNFFLAWTQVESNPIGNAYADLVSEARRRAGTAMKAAWEDPPITEDAHMSIPRSLVDLNGLQTYEVKYFKAIQDHLK